MTETMLQRARLLNCHAQVFAKAPYTPWDALHAWYANRAA